MTYKRVDSLSLTIEKIFQQTFSPQKLLIVDNDPACSAREVLGSFPDYPISYHAVGYNSGPAGASKAGLQILADEGFDWIAWIDDDDPPFFEDTFNVLLQMAQGHPGVGCVGSVGQRFSFTRGLIERIEDKELEGNGLIFVDNIAGNMSKIVNAEVIRFGKVLPSEEFFFGFEELDFDIRMKAAGFSLVCDKGHYKRHRIYHNRTGYQRRLSKKKNNRELTREYYSTRNILFILLKKRALQGILFVVFRSALKSIAGFRHGISYGISNARVLILALIHFVMQRKGAFRLLADK